MSTATVKLKHGALATVTPDFTITRGITETHSLTLLNADNTALIHASVVTWTFQIAQDFLSRTSIYRGRPLGCFFTGTGFGRG